MRVELIDDVPNLGELHHAGCDMVFRIVFLRLNDLIVPRQTCNLFGLDRRREDDGRKLVGSGKTINV